MEKLTSTLTRQSRSISFDNDLVVIRAMAAGEKFWREHQAELAEKLNVHSVFALFDEAQKDAGFSATISSLAAAGGIAGEIGKVTAKLGKISGKYRNLLLPLADFDEQKQEKNVGEMVWKLFDIGHQHGGSNGKYGFDLGASAQLTLEAGDTWPSPDDAMPYPLLRLSLAGSLTANANVTLPFNVGSVGIGTKNSASTEVSYYVGHAQGISYAQAVAGVLGDLPSPFSFESIWMSLLKLNMKGIILKVGGSSSLDLEVSIEQGYSLANGIEATAGLTVKARAKYTGGYELIVRSQSAAGTPSMVVALQRRSLKEAGYGIDLGIEVDLKSLADRLRETLNKHEEAFAKALEDYRDFLSPGTYLQNKLETELSQKIEEMISNEQLRSALSSAASAAVGVDTESNLEALKKCATEAVTNALDSVGDVLSGTTSVVAQEVAEAAGNVLGLDPLLIQSSLLPVAERLVERVQQKLVETVKSSSGSKIDELISRLRKAGISVSQAGTRTDQALSGLRNLIDRYESLLKKLIAATEDAVRTRITAKLSYEETRTSGYVVEAQATFLRNTPEAEKAFDTLLRGNFNEILGLLREKPLDFDFDETRTSLTRFAAFEQKKSFEVVFLGFEFGTTSIFSTDAHVTSDAAGNVYVMTKGTWAKHKNTSKEKREIQFVDSFQLSAARVTNSVTLNLGIKYEDENLKRNELSDFLNRFERAGLLPSDAVSRAGRLLDEWQGMAPEASVKADVNLGLRLDGKSVAALMRLSDRTESSLSKDNVSSAARRVIFRSGMEALHTGGVYSLNQMHDYAKEIYRAAGFKSKDVDQLSYASAVELLYGFVEKTYNAALKWAPPNAGGPIDVADDKRRDQKFNSAFRVHELCMKLVTFVEILGDIYQSTPDPSGKKGWREKDYVTAQRHLNACYAEWLRDGGNFLSNPRTIAFIAALLDLCRSNSTPNGPRLTLTMVRRSGTEKKSVLIA